MLKKIRDVTVYGAIATLIADSSYLEAPPDPARAVLAD